MQFGDGLNGPIQIKRVHGTIFSEFQIMMNLKLTILVNSVIEILLFGLELVIFISLPILLDS